jgi:acetolactate synthase-1/2/3 large subunit
MNDINNNYPAAPDFASESPINLLANQPVAEYGSDLIAELIGHLGHDYIFLTPGSSFRGVHDSLVNHTRNHKPQIILVAHEEMAVAMAQGYCKATGRPAMCFLHDLVGVQHATMAFYNAMADRMPVVVLGGSGPADPAHRRKTDWIHSANTQCDIVRDVTKWTDEPITLQACLDSMARAQHIATSAPSAPTYVSVDVVVQEAEIPDGVTMPEVSAPRFQPTAPIAAPNQQVDAAVDLLTAADWPLIFGGRIGYHAGATPLLRELVETLGAGYQDGHDIICMPSNHPQNLNASFGRTRAEGEYKAKFLGMADVILCIDCLDISNNVGAYEGARGAGKAIAGKPRKIIDLSLNEFAIQHWTHLGGPMQPVDVQVQADGLHGLGQLLDEVRRRAAGNPAWLRKAGERRAEIAKMHDELRARQQETMKAKWDQVPIYLPRMTAELYNAVKDRDWMLAARNYRAWYDGIWEFDGAGQFMSNSIGGGVGYGAAGVIGSALAVRDQGKLAVAIIGDGDFTMGPAALWTAAHYRIPILIVLHNNTSFGNDEEHQITLANRRGRPAENAWIGQRMVGPEPDYCSVARGYGAWAEQPVRDPDDLAGAFARAVAVVEKGGVALVDVHTSLN